jgi:hypothetical protein
MGLGGEPARFESAGDFAALAAQVARLDERTLGMQRQIDERFASVRREIAGLYAVVVVGFTVLGWLVTRLPH